MLVVHSERFHFLSVCQYTEKHWCDFMVLSPVCQVTCGRHTQVQTELARGCIRCYKVEGFLFSVRVGQE